MNTNNELQSNASDAAATPAAPGSTLPAPSAPLPFTPAPGESPRAFEACCAYLDLGPQRRYAAVARKLGVSLRSVKRWADQFDWRARLNAHAAHRAERAAEIKDAEVLEAAAREKSFHDRQFFLAEAILDLTERYFERVDDIDFEHVRLPDVCRALEFATRLIQQAKEAEAARPDTGLREHLKELLNQAYGEAEKPAASAPTSPQPLTLN